MQVTFLGTSAGVPTMQRNVSSVALRLPQRAEAWLFDCGEGTQHRLLRSDLKFSQLARIFITHLHGDHLFGLPGLLATGRLAGAARRTVIYGPAGLEDYLRACWQHTEADSSFPVEVRAVQPGVVHEEEGFTVRCLPLRHRVPTFGYRVEEHDRAGSFNVERARALEIPFGPIYGRLKAGEIVTLDDGRTFDGREFQGATEHGRTFVYCTDTFRCDAAIELARDADVLIHEATFADEDFGLARRSLHSTTVMAAQVASEARVKQLVITHISPRYAPGGKLQPNDLLREARAVFPNTEIAHDFLSFEIPRRVA